MKKICIVLTPNCYTYGGISTVILTYLENMNLDGLNITIVSSNDPDEPAKKLMSALGVRYVQLPARKKHIILYFKQFKELCKKEKFDIVHMNGNSSTMLFELEIAKKSGIKTRIAHCHSTGTFYKFFHKIMNNRFNRSYTKALAVSEEAGRWAYGDRNFIILNNAVDTSKFKYDVTKRNEYRRMLGLEKNVVLGTIGKLNNQKNQTFLIEIMPEIIKKHPECRLLLVGKGKYRNELEKMVHERNLEKFVIFLGARLDNVELLQAMDLFVFPSRYEGFGLACLEAQISGLPCVCSEFVPKQALVSKEITVLPLNKEQWVEYLGKEIDALNLYDRKAVSEATIQLVIENRLDIEHEADKLRKVYLQ